MQIFSTIVHKSLSIIYNRHFKDGLSWINFVSTLNRSSYANPDETYLPEKERKFWIDGYEEKQDGQCKNI